MYKLRDFVEENKHKLDKGFLCNNTSLGLVNFLKNNENFIDYNNLAYNENAIHFDYFTYHILCENFINQGLLTNESYGYLIEKHFELLKSKDCFDWYYLSQNKYLTQNFIKKYFNNQDHWNFICKYNKNSEIFYKEIYERGENSKNLNWSYLSNNEYIIEFLNNYEHKIDFYYLVSNKNAIDLIEKNLDEIISDKYDQYQIWEYLCKNYNAIILIKKHFEKIKNKINWEELCFNKNPQVIDILNKNLDCIRTPSFGLSCNKNAINILKKNKKFINWYSFSGNSSAIDMIEEKYHEEKKLSNEEYNNLHRDNKINWGILSSNELIFKFDYKQMKLNCKNFTEELVKYVFHPDRINRFFNKYNYNIITEEYYYND